MSIILFIKSKGLIRYIGPPSEEARPWARKVQNYHSSLVGRPPGWSCASLPRSSTEQWRGLSASGSIMGSEHPVLIRRFFCLWVGSFSFWISSSGLQACLICLSFILDQLIHSWSKTSQFTLSTTIPVASCRKCRGHLVAWLAWANIVPSCDEYPFTVVTPVSVTAVPQ